MDAKIYHRRQLMRVADQANGAGKAHLADELSKTADYIDGLHARLEATKTLRDEFAMAALVLCGGNMLESYTARDAYKIADAMLEARNANR